MATTSDFDTTQAKSSTSHVEHSEKILGDDHTNDHGHVEGNALILDREGEIRRVPVPSNDPNDPLNFSAWERYSVIFCCCWFSLLGLSLAQGLAPILNIMTEMYMPQGYTVDEILFLITILTLCIGLGNYIILPLGLAFGRRPVFLVATIILLGATIGSAVQNSYNAHLGTRIVQGLATGAAESLLPLMLTEITFLHERSRVFGLYWMIQSILGCVINLSTSYLNHALGWRWFYWLFVITISTGLVFVLLGGFETQFYRSAASVDGQLVITDEFGVMHIIPDSEAQAHLDRVQQREVQQSEGDGVDVPRKKTYLQRIKPWSTPQPRPFHVIVTSWLHMAQSLTSPGIIYAILTSSMALGCLVGISLTYNEVLIQEYNWSPESVGLINVGGIIGSVFGMLYCALLADRFVLWAGSRNRGVHMPEHHLITMGPPAIIGVGMLLLYGFTAHGGSTWWGPYMGWTIFQFAFTSIVIISSTFASEAAPQHQVTRPHC
ncbi:hypothetical protein COCVIDRAFT_108177 [Bipolaris victoriae FI3]|uniref:Major facilitator superfamily (MFS) profile domain-containing protein n=1 Tax=Bipolaris victoriae (strain FI3) TaxID=930091 RepID=W7ECR1_BIPV3|nr:hypothetical protein COCVIDRAFT_108177 [Bipolaris victoriae FI3]